MISNVGLRELAGLKRLRLLDVQNTKVTEAGVAALNKALPDLKVSR
jgi:hypothetical protein